MLSNIRKFSKTFFAKIILVIVIIPFVFWGMGGVFSSGNTNSLAKINNVNISTEDFIDHINNLNINEEIIREKINENILEEILTALISKELLALEIKDLNILYQTPVIFCVLTDNNIGQSLERSGGKYGNKGEDSALTALKLISTIVK